MAHAGEQIENPRTGQRMVFLQTGAETDGELLQIGASTRPAGSMSPSTVIPDRRAAPR